MEPPRRDVTDGHRENQTPAEGTAPKKVIDWRLKCARASPWPLDRGGGGDVLLGFMFVLFYRKYSPIVFPELTNRTPLGGPEG